MTGRRLTKRQVEALLSGYDADPVGTLSVALRTVLDRDDAVWPELVAAAGFTPSRTAALLVGEEGALDDLARELNELRTLAGR